MTNRLARFLGNPALVKRIRAKIAEERVPHGLIFSGPEGVGKRTFALEIAQALNCPTRLTTDDKDGKPCGSCEVCQKIQAGIHPEISTVTLEDDASQIKIEQIRLVRSQLEIEALNRGGRVFLIDPADRMTPGAASALLKALEEPPARTYFILITTNAQELLLTIQSRCQVYHFAPLRLEEIRDLGIKDELIVRWSQGSIGRALASDADELRNRRDELLEFVELAVLGSEEDLITLFDASAEIARSKEEYYEKIRTLKVLISDLLFAKEDLEGRIVNVDQRDRIQTIAATVDLERIVQIGDCIRFVESALKHYGNRRMLTDSLIFSLNERTSQILNDKPWKYG